jgi:hypothetical protein
MRHQLLVCSDDVILLGKPHELYYTLVRRLLLTLTYDKIIYILMPRRMQEKS